jgi:hypothetical protein
MILRRIRERRAARARGERGVAMVEMAIVAPLLALIVGGIVEYGTLWRDDLTVTTSTRAAARVVSNLGDDYLADYEALLSLNAGLATIDGIDIEGVLIFKADAVDGEPHPQCFDAAGDPRDYAGQCNHYSAADLALVDSIDCSVACAQFPDNANCAGAMTVYFCPQTQRQTDQSSGLTSVGVWVRVSRDYLTGLFPGEGVTITDDTVMKVEPS